MNVALITEAIPPAPVVGSFRAANIARAFRDQGHHVHIVTLRGGHETESRGQLAEGITWQRVKAWPGPRQAYGALRRLVRPGSDAAPERSEPTPPAVSPQAAPPRPALRRVLAALITLPDDRQGFVPAALRALWPRRRSIDLIYSTAPCFSALLAGRAASSILAIPWVAELRDPWVGNASRKSQARIPFIRRLDERLERFCLSAADAIVTVTPRAQDEYRRRYPGARVLCALNGIAAVAPRSRNRRPGPLRLVYAGSLYPPRNPAPIVEALRAAYVQLDPAPPLELAFIGAEGWEEAPGLADATRTLPPGMQLQRCGWVPPAEARALIDDADLLLLPAQEWLLQVPNKLYDYLGSRVPILAIAERGSDTALMLERAGGHYVAYADGDHAELLAAAQAALRAAMHGLRSGDDQLMSVWRTAEQLGRLVLEVLPAPDRPSSDAVRIAPAHDGVSS